MFQSQNNEVSHLQTQKLSKEIRAQISNDHVEGDAGSQHQPDHTARTQREMMDIDTYDIMFTFIGYVKSVSKNSL